MFFFCSLFWPILKGHLLGNFEQGSRGAKDQDPGGLLAFANTALSRQGNHDGRGAGRQIQRGGDRCLCRWLRGALASKPSARPPPHGAFARPFAFSWRVPLRRRKVSRAAAAAMHSRLRALLGLGRACGVASFSHRGRGGGRHSACGESGVAAAPPQSAARARVGVTGLRRSPPVGVHRLVVLDRRGGVQRHGEQPAVHHLRGVDPGFRWHARHCHVSHGAHRPQLHPPPKNRRIFILARFNKVPSPAQTPRLPTRASSTVPLAYGTRDRAFGAAPSALVSISVRRGRPETGARARDQRGQSESRVVERPGRERTGKRGAGARAHEGQERTWKRGREGMHAMLRAGFVGV